MDVFTIEIERDGAFFVAQCAERKECFTQGETLGEVLRNMREVLELMLEVENPQMEARVIGPAVDALLQAA